jgi:hypothetical protein
MEGWDPLWWVFGDIGDKERTFYDFIISLRVHTKICVSEPVLSRLRSYEFKSFYFCHKLQKNWVKMNM